MAKSSHTPATVPETVWLARGSHPGAAAEEAVRRRLEELRENGVIQGSRAVDDGDGSGNGNGNGSVFEARWQVPGAITVRARLTIDGPRDDGAARNWVIAAEAERPWDLNWPSPATVFWPEDAGDEPPEEALPWDRDPVTGLRFRDTNPLPTEDKELRRLLKTSVRGSWSIHVVVHEAMTPDEHGRLPLTRLMPPSLRHRVVEHRAAPEQFQVVNWALSSLGVQVPRGGAVVLPGTPARPGYKEDDFTVRSVFLDGSEPSGLIDAVTRFAALPRPLSEEADQAVSDLRGHWNLLTVEEELAKARALVATYAEALDAMTKSRDLYREAAELAHEALTAVREGPGPAVAPAQTASRGRESSPFRSLTRPLERLRENAKALRPAGRDGTPGAPEAPSEPTPPPTDLPGTMPRD